MRIIFWGVVLVTMLTGCAEWSSSPIQSGVDLQWMNTTVRPQDDLYRHVSGKWLETAVIPEDRARYGAFDQLRDQSEARLRSIIESLVGQSDLDPESEARKMADLYRDFMDEPALEAGGMTPLTEELSRIDGVQSHEALIGLMGYLATLGISVPIEPSIAPDAREATRYAVYISQGGLGMPDREYYLNTTDPRLTHIREAYQHYLEMLFTLAHESAPALSAQKVLSLETALAQVQWTKVENRDSIKTYNKISVAELDAQISPDFAWATWQATMEINGRVDALIVRQPSYFKAMAALTRSAPLEDWKTYLRSRLLDAYAPYLNADFVNAQFQFHGKTVRGIPENRPRWKRGVAVVDSSMGEALGHLYVDQIFPESSKLRMQTLVDHLLTAYRQSIETLPWMSLTTRQEALRKLAALNTKIGYPNRWRDYSALVIRPGELLGNLMRANQFETRRQINKLGGPIDREEWGMTPQTVNAYYSARLNEIVFPAAILQPPFFNPEADDSVNYGAIGAVIGHEISHAFDDQGSQSDGQGNLRNWWSDEDRQQFSQRTHALVEQYDAYSPLPGYFVNGELTLGENIADNSGLAIAFKAYHLALGEESAPVIDGMDGNQRFYCGWVQAWRSRVRDAEILRLLKVDPHAPAAFRANGPLVNQPGFQKAFGTKPGDLLYRAPDQQVILW
ncbi:MAG: M13 family metallopeptidase [Betaproteobacteria bacterium]|nr:M13 family metallopeptidase [Betaproteobacteria bacterium]